MSYFNDHPLNEAAVFGGELGNTLGKMAYQVPLQRAQMLRDYAQMQQQQQYHQMLNQLQQQRIQDLEEYRQGLLGLGQRKVDNSYELGVDRNAISQQRADQSGAYNTGRLKLGQMSIDERKQYHQKLGAEHDRALEEKKRADIQNEITRNLLAQGRIALDETTMGKAAMPQYHGNIVAPGLGQPAIGNLPGGGAQLPQNVNPNADMRNQLEMLKLKAGLGGTNSFPEILQGIQQLMQRGQTNAPGLPTPQASQYNWDPTNGLVPLQQ